MGSEKDGVIEKSRGGSKRLSKQRFMKGRREIKRETIIDIVLTEYCLLSSSINFSKINLSVVHFHFMTLVAICYAASDQIRTIVRRIKSSVSLIILSNA